MKLRFMLANLKSLHADYIWFFDIAILLSANMNLWFDSLDGRQERVMFDKITSRIQKLCYGLNMDFVDPVSK